MTDEMNTRLTSAGSESTEPEPEEPESAAQNVKENVPGRLTDIRVVAVLALISCFLWGSATVSIKAGYELFSIDTSDTAAILLFAGIRFVLAALLLIAVQSVQRKRLLLPPAGAAPAILKLCMAQTVLHYCFLYVGLAHTSGVQTSIATATNVFISVLMAALIFRMERLNKRKLLACALGFAGIVLMNLPGAGDTLQFRWNGDALVIFAQLFYALSSIMIKRYGQHYDVVMMSAYQFLAGGIILCLLGFGSGGRVDMLVGVNAYMILLYLAFISAVAYSLWSLLLKYNPVSRVTIFAFMNPMFGVILAALLLGEYERALRWNSLAALVMVCIGIYLLNVAPGAPQTDRH